MWLFPMAELKVSSIDFGVIKFTCPQCRKQWYEIQWIGDEWYGLATTQTLCVKCGQEAIQRVKEKWKQDDQLECNGCNTRNYKMGKTN